MSGSMNTLSGQGGNRQSINGGAQRSQDRRPTTGSTPPRVTTPTQRPTTGQPRQQDRSINSARQSREAGAGSVNAANRGNSDRASGRPGAQGAGDRSVSDRVSRETAAGGRERPTADRAADGNRTNRDRESLNRPGGDRNRPGGGNNINIGNNNNININAQRNTVVRVNMFHPMMMRPPFMWGGVSVFMFRPFFFFPFSPMFWGPMWHPWGFHAPMPPPQSQVVTVRNETNVFNETNVTNITNVTNVVNEFQYYEGVFYQKDDEGYVVVPAPVGASVKSIPDNYEKVEVGENEFHYYWGGTFYEKKGNEFIVVPPTAGALVTNISEGGEEVKMGERVLYRFGETYYMPVSVDGKNMYEIVYLEYEEDEEDN